MFNLLHSSTNEEFFKKHLFNQSSHHEKYGCYTRNPSHTTTKSTLFTVSKDEWNTKEESGKSMKNALYSTYCGMSKSTSPVEVTSNSEQNQAHSLELCLSVTDSVTQSVSHR